MGQHILYQPPVSQMSTLPSASCHASASPDHPVWQTVCPAEPPEVATGIFEHYLPRHAGDALPGSRPAIAVGVADRLDSLTGLFAAGLAPRSTADPFALRRAALGLAQVLAERGLAFDLRRAVREGRLAHAPGDELAHAARAAGLLSDGELALLHAADRARDEAIQVDAFTPEEFARLGGR